MKHQTIVPHRLHQIVDSIGWVDLGTVKQLLTAIATVMDLPRRNPAKHAQQPSRRRSGGCTVDLSLRRQDTAIPGQKTIRWYYKEHRPSKPNPTFINGPPGNDSCTTASERSAGTFRIPPLFFRNVLYSQAGSLGLIRIGGLIMKPNKPAPIMFQKATDTKK